MIPIESWKKRIVRFFVVKSHPHTYRASGSKVVFDSFGANIDANTQIAFDELIEDGILLRLMSNNKEFFVLNFREKMEEIRYMMRTDLLEEKAGLIQPDSQEIKGLKFMFHTTSERGFPNRGIYFYYVKDDDEDHWETLIRTRPNVKPYHVILYSLKDADSKISRIWKASQEVYKNGNFQPFFRKQVEDEDQEACDNRRLGSKAAFDIFLYKNWIKVVKRIGRVTYYEIPSLKPQNIVETKNPTTEKQN